MTFSNPFTGTILTPQVDYWLWPAISGESFPPTLAGGSAYAATSGRPCWTATNAGDSVTFPYLPVVGPAQDVAGTLSWTFNYGGAFGSGAANCNPYLALNVDQGAAQRVAFYAVAAGAFEEPRIDYPGGTIVPSLSGNVLQPSTWYAVTITITGKQLTVAHSNPAYPGTDFTTTATMTNTLGTVVTTALHPKLTNAGGRVAYLTNHRIGWS